MLEREGEVGCDEVFIVRNKGHTVKVSLIVTWGGSKK